MSRIIKVEFVVYPHPLAVGSQKITPAPTIRMNAGNALDQRTINFKIANFKAKAEIFILLPDYNLPATFHSRYCTEANATVVRTLYSTIFKSFPVLSRPTERCHETENFVMPYRERLLRPEHGIRALA